ncbi:MAG: hypothetical protein KatS3mg082_2801 [Nitrospiraceae bacterium]|nr:MAG: hypothetical protein KatS3mg082_2801 [Nitrospiraceae bacterium]
MISESQHASPHTKTRLGAFRKLSQRLRVASVRWPLQSLQTLSDDSEAGCRLHLHRPALRWQPDVFRAQLPLGSLAQGLYEQQARSDREQGPRQGSARIPAADDGVLQGVLPRAQAGPLDDGGVPQLQEQRLEQHSGGAANRGLRHRRCAHAGQEAGFVQAGDQRQRRQTGPGHFVLQAERGAGRALQA